MMSSSPAIVKVEMCQRKSIFGYKGNEDRLFLKIITHLPTHIAPAKRYLERGMNVPVIGDIVRVDAYDDSSIGLQSNV